ncbi:MAG TPA: LCP family protein [Pseudonocardiaceae bacterium]|nr:LCP family protein [Pseudonocardiaceae bacterium]
MTANLVASREGGAVVDVTATDDATTVAAPATGRSRGRRAGVAAGRTLLALVSAMALVAVGVAWFTVDRFKANTNTTSALAQVGGEPNQPPADDGATDILLVGDDSRTNAQGAPLPNSVLKQLRTQFDAGVNTDTIMLLRLPDNGGPTYAVSIPRDSYVAIPGYQTDKINSAYGVTKSRAAQQLSAAHDDRATIEQQSTAAGQKALIETVQNLTGVHVDHYVEVNLYGFYLLSKAIGGVEVCLKHSTSDPDSGSNFHAGTQLVSGADALSFVRQRKNLPSGDLDRIVRQQVFLASAAHKVLSAGTLTSPSALSALLDVLKQSLVTDPGLDFTSLVQQLQGLASGTMTFVTIPVVNSNARSPSGQSIVQVDVNQVHQFMTALTHPQTATPTPPPPAHTTKPAPTTATTTTPAAPAATPTNEPTPPVSLDGVRCVD